MGSQSTVSVRKASPADSAVIAALHQEEIPWGQLANLGPGIVAAFYRTLLDSDLGFAFIAERDGLPLGYVTGIVHWRRFYRTFVRRHWVLAARLLIRRLFDVGRWRRLVETTRYATTATLPDAELLAIALRPEARGTGTADVLVHELLSEFASRGVTQVRVTTASENVAAARIYERAGFQLRGEVAIHRGEGARVYVISVDGRHDSTVH